jgi:SAM-dependent methyltransferase
MLDLSLTTDCKRQTLSLSRVYEKMFPSRVYYIAKALSDCESVLDLGCGTGDLMVGVTKEDFYAVGVDLFKPYLKVSKGKKSHDDLVMANIQKIEFKPKSFDAVMAVGVIEHLSKDKVALLIEKMKTWARKKVLLFTPNGFVIQKEYDKNPLQIHKSGWTMSELKTFGFEVYGMSGLSFLRGEEANVRFKPKIVWEIISELTQKISYRYPVVAFELLCIQTLT